MTIGDTIVAPSTPFGHSGLAVVRVSGVGAIQILSKLSSRINFSNRLATLSTLNDLNGDLIDRCIITVFYGPNSYTGEDVVEISTHGNPSVVGALVGAVCAHGGRLAHPGEFTRQAFLNGKMDLVQAEAVAALIRSKSIESSRSQQKIIDGSLSIRLNIIQSNLSDLLSRLEHLLDISEEDVLSSDVNALLVDLDKISLTVNQLQKSFFLGRLLSGGATVVIVGATNVGKSTLLNRLSESDRAIVSNVPGTTRDTIDVELILDGVPVLFVDTAGLRDAKNSIEKEGVKRTYKAIEGADLVISLTDSPTKKHFTGSDRPTINVLNKADLRNDMKTDGHIIHISAKSGAGINDLKGRLINDLGINRLSTEEDYLSTSRQHLSIKECSFALSRARSFFESDVLDVELLSFEVRSALDAIDALLGKTSPDKILNNIFDKMCVGK